MAHICEPLCRDVAAWLSGQCGHPVAFVDDVDWRERERLLARFAALSDADYDPIRFMWRVARDVPMRRR